MSFVERRKAARGVRKIHVGHLHIAVICLCTEFEESRMDCVFNHLIDDRKD